MGIGRVEGAREASDVLVVDLQRLDELRHREFAWNDFDYYY